MPNKITRIGIFLGGMRCGSTAFRDYMLQHPQVCMHKTKDPHYFSSEANWAQGLDWYLSGWVDFKPNVHKIAVESSTHYTKYPLYPRTAEHMASIPMDLRLVYGVRDPVERVESHLVHNSGKGYLDPDDPSQRHELLKQAINVSNYDLQMSQYEPFFQKRQIHLMVLKELKLSPVETMKKIFIFFGIDPDFVVSKIGLRPRKFKNKVEGISLTLKERKWVAEELRLPTRRFEERYGVEIQD